MSEKKLYWFAVYTKPRWEKKIASVLNGMGIENYCPLNKVVRQWSDRKKVILEPLFKSYVFVRLPEDEKWEIKNVNGVLNFVYWLGKPAHIKDAEISLIKKFLNEFAELEVRPQKVRVNSLVKIKQGIMMNHRGVIIELAGNKAKVQINSMGLELVARFDKNNLEPIMQEIVSL